MAEPAAATPVRAAVDAAARTLADAGLPSPRVDAELLAAHLLGVPRGRLLSASLAPDQAAAYYAAVTRRAAHEPLQHVTGVAYFRRLELAVGPGVFVPRPETELLVDWLLAALAGTECPVVVDLCTGSGAVALAVAGEHPGAVVHAVERDAAAYRWACRNAAGSGVHVWHADAAEWGAELTGTVDAVVANPPYVPTGAPVDADVEHDPAVALYAGPDGLDGVRTVAAAAARLLRPGGVLGCEHDAGHGDSAPGLLAGLGGWTEVTDHGDLTGRPRFVTAVRTTAVATTERHHTTQGNG